MSGKDDAERIATLEAKVETLHEWAGDLSDSIKESTTSMHRGLEKLTDAVHELASIKMDHERHSVEIDTLRRRQHDFANSLGRVDQHDIRIGHLEQGHSAVSAKVDNIVKMIPNLQLASGWVFKATLFIMAGLGAVAMAVIVRGGVG